MKSGEFMVHNFGEKMPDFVVPHDGTQPEVTDTEQALVADKFSSLVDDTMLAHIEDITSTSAGESRVVLGSFRREPGLVWKLKITRAEDFEPLEGVEYADQKLAVIELTRDMDGRAKEQLSYRLGADGVVRRHTVEDVEKKRKHDREFYVLDEAQRNTGDEDSMSTEELYRQKRREAAANRKLERELGVNMQPVGFEEITSLTDFISDMKLETPRVYNKRVMSQRVQS